MGYEVIYTFAKLENGEYNKQEKHTGSIKVGDPYQEVELDVLAGKVMALLARRNILVSDIKVFEIVKKELAFREAEDGIVIKNRKFKFDDGSSITGEDMPEDVTGKIKELLAVNPNLLQQLTAQPTQKFTAPVAPGAAINKLQLEGKPLRFETHIKADDFWFEFAKKMSPTCVITLGKSYPIYKEEIVDVPSPRGCVLYTIVDDNGRQQRVNDKLFAGMVKQENTDGKLQWSGVVDDQYGRVPNLRGR